MLFVVGGWCLLVGGWWLVVGGWWWGGWGWRLVVGGWRKETGVPWTMHTAVNLGNALSCI